MEPPYADILPLEDVLSELEALDVEGASTQLLSPTHRRLHNIVHSQLVDHHHDNGIIPLRSLHDMPLPLPIRPTLNARLYYWRCRAQLSWRWAWRWGLRVGRYSADMMHERYACGRSWAGVNRSRVHQLAKRISSTR